MGDPKLAAGERAMPILAGGTDRSQPMELPSHETLSELARDDPQAYEALRRDLIESFIGSAPARLTQRLNGIQFRVDGVRQLSGPSGLGATLRIYNLMWESFLCLNGNWQEFVHMGRACDGSYGSCLNADSVPQRSALVLKFPSAPCRDQNWA